MRRCWPWHKFVESYSRAFASGSLRVAGDNVRDQKSLRDYATLLALAQIRRKL